MKNNILILLFTFCFSFVSFGQQSKIKIIAVDNPEVGLNGQSIEVEGSSSDIDIPKEFRVINTSQETLKVFYKRIRVVNSGRIDQICDQTLCFSATNTYEYTSPIENEIAPGDSSLFKPQMVPAGEEFCAVHTYYVVNSFGQKYDSITVLFKTTNSDCVLSTSSFYKSTFKIFPNPMQDVVTINGDAIKNGGTVVFTDALGKEVKRTVLNSGTSSVNVAELRRGVYFVNVYNKQGDKSAVQRVIKQ